MTKDQIEAFEELNRSLRYRNYLFCLKEIHDMGFIDDIEYKDYMKTALSNQHFKCTEKFWNRGIK